MVGIVNGIDNPYHWYNYRYTIQVQREFANQQTQHGIWPIGFHQRIINEANPFPKINKSNTKTMNMGEGIARIW